MKITKGEIHFRRKDLRQKKIVITKYSAAEFVQALGDHVPDRYRNAIRYFGLLAPRSKRLIAHGLLALLRQQKRILAKLSLGSVSPEAPSMSIPYLTVAVTPCAGSAG